MGSSLQRVVVIFVAMLAVAGCVNPAGRTDGGPPDFSAVVAANRAAVVHLSVVQAPPAPDEEEELDEDTLQEFLGRFGLSLPLVPEQPEPVQASAAGFIVSADGYILTTAHVVQDALQVTVKLTDRREFPARIVGSDAGSGVALLKIDARQLPAVRLGDAAGVRSGQWVLAIGSPFGLEDSASVGIVSATARALPGQSDVPLIQTDVAINPGNSGGPLFNRRGEVVGINSRIVSRSGGYMGVSFAIPIDVARRVQAQLLRDGNVQRGYLGVLTQEVGAALAEVFGLDRPRGALVTAVDRGSPAERAGLRPGDVLLRVAGRELESNTPLPAMVAALRPGHAAQLGVWRERALLQVEVRSIAAPEPRAAAPAAPAGDAGDDLLGLSVRALSDAERARLEVRGPLLVTQATAAAAIAGIRAGDVIVGVNERPVATVAQLREAIRAAGRPLALLVEREQEQLFLAVPAAPVAAP